MQSSRGPSTDQVWWTLSRREFLAELNMNRHRRSLVSSEMAHCGIILKLYIRWRATSPYSTLRPASAVALLVCDVARLGWLATRVTNACLRIAPLTSPCSATRCASSVPAGQKTVRRDILCKEAIIHGGLPVSVATTATPKIVSYPIGFRVRRGSCVLCPTTVPKSAARFQFQFGAHCL
jgi:hypothetical protein